MNESLPSLLADDRQGALFSIPATFREVQEVRGEYTAERLFSQQRDKYETIVAMLAAKRGIRAIKRACEVHHDTIHAVAAREKMSIDTLKERIVQDLEVAIQVGAERLVDVMESIKPENLPIGLGIAIDKYQLLTGGATVRVETGETPSAKLPATFEDWLATVKRAETGLGEEGGKAKGGAASDGAVSGSLGMGAAGELAGAGSAVHRVGGECVCVDVESVVLLCNTGAATALDTSAGCAVVAVRAGGLKRGEGGAEEPGGALREPTDSGSGNFISKGASTAAGPGPDDGALGETPPIP